jgi:hypothetical protein
MTAPGELDPITFMPTREITEAERRRLELVARSLGMASTSPPEPILPLTREELLDEHVTRTYPTDETSFMAKEHFWIIGEEAGIETRTESGRLFIELCFPVWLNTRRYFPRHDKLARSELGLVVERRSKVGLPAPTIPLGGNPSYRVLAHSSSYPHGKTLLNDTAIQIRGVAALIDGGHDLARIFTPQSRAALQTITPRLREFTQ